jgi:hypothetical protein
MHDLWGRRDSSIWSHLIMWPFDKPRKNIGSASGLTSLEQQQTAIKLLALEIRIVGLEQAIIELCKGLKMNFDRIDENTMRLDKNMHNLAAMTLRPLKDLLGGTKEPN